jgi:HTH-type transcriptional regulator, competence development regulator
MERACGTLVRQLRLHKGYSLRELGRRIGLSPNFPSNMEKGHFPPPGEQQIVLIAETLEQNTDELLALAGKLSSDLIEIILQRPKATAALLRRLRHAPANRIAAAKDRLAAAEPLEFYPLETISRENHTAVVGESGSGKSLLTKYLIQSYFKDADVKV